MCKFRAHIARFSLIIYIDITHIMFLPCLNIQDLIDNVKDVFRGRIRKMSNYTW